jgi:hypothetical protein
MEHKDSGSMLQKLSKFSTTCVYAFLLGYIITMSGHSISYSSVDLWVSKLRLSFWKPCNARATKAPNPGGLETSGSLLSVAMMHSVPIITASKKDALISKSRDTVNKMVTHKRAKRIQMPTVNLPRQPGTSIWLASYKLTAVGNIIALILFQSKIEQGGNNFFRR